MKREVSKMNWNDEWRKELKEKNANCFNRLSDCRSTANDVAIMAKYVHKYNPTVSKKDCFDRMIGWVCDWNNQFELFDKIDKQYDKLLAKV
jgi:hypothetical protein